MPCSSTTAVETGDELTTMAKTEPARFVQVTLSPKGLIKEIIDKNKPHLLPERESQAPKTANLSLEGEHYEWNLSKYFNTGVPLTQFYKSQMPVAANRQNANHRNTARLTVPELIKLDCGHWGGYKRWQEFDGEGDGPQREFGLI